MDTGSVEYKYPPSQKFAAYLHHNDTEIDVLLFISTMSSVALAVHNAALSHRRPSPSLGPTIRFYTFNVNCPAVNI
nr:hypothetical protein HmN_000297100 [Hymenolepis microstoma]